MIKTVFLLGALFMTPLFLTAQKGPYGPFGTTLVPGEKQAFAAEAALPSTAALVLNTFLRTFQLTFSRQDGPNCRYHPTCSLYAAIAIRRYGPLAGVIMSSDRFLRCNPFGAWGEDLPEDNYFFGQEP